MFVRSDLYLKNGGLDDSFFAHMEEIDFCWRMKNLGYKIFCCPQSKVYHIGGGTLPKSSARKTYLNFRNNMSLLYKNLPSCVFLTLAYRVLLDWVAAFKFLFSGGLADFWAVIRAHFDFYKRIPAIKKTRKELPHRQVGQMYRKNIVFENFLKGKKKYSDLDSEKFFHA